MKHYEELSGSERRIRILEILREKGEVTVAELAETFGVTVMTIRRDLHFYEDQGILEMHYGGAKLREAAPPFAVLSKRGELHHAEKKEIAKRAAQEIKEGDIIFLDTSTTVLPVLDYIPDIRLTVVTNSLPAMVRLSERHKIKSIACPGHYQELYGGLMDISTVEYLRSYHFQKAFLGASMCDPDFGISCDEEIEAAIKKTVLAQSDHSYLLIDYSKMNSRTFIKISDVDVFDAVFTNAQLNQTMKEIYAANGGKLVFC